MSVATSSVMGMRDLGLDAGGAGGGVPTGVLPTLAEVRVWTARLGGSGRALDDSSRIDLLRALEELKCAAEGAQAEVTADFDRSRRAHAARGGEPAERRSRGIGHQVAARPTRLTAPRAAAGGPGPFAAPPPARDPCAAAGRTDQRVAGRPDPARDLLPHPRPPTGRRQDGRPPPRRGRLDQRPGAASALSTTSSTGSSLRPSPSAGAARSPTATPACAPPPTR